MQNQNDISAIIIDKENRGEASIMLTAFSAEEGLVFLFKRMSAKKTSIVPDLFDEIVCQTKPPESSKNTPIHFLQNFDVLKHRTGIATSYEKLCVSAEIAKIIKINGENIDEKQSLFNLLTKTFDAIESTQNLKAVQIKFLYLLTKEQGYAIKEDFFQSLSSDDKTTFTYILKNPAQNLHDYIQQAENIYIKLKRWIQTNTDIIVE
ncbi:MAG: hypothetical protein E7035_04435 [Verrucomicrobiaceae bacterium]|nr:hypothetical protein [Verrucomicrobiaceae bacterium]